MLNTVLITWTDDLLAALCILIIIHKFHDHIIVDVNFKETKRDTLCVVI